MSNVSSAYPVQSIVDQAVSKQTNALLGNNDINLNTIVKMSLMAELSQLEEENIKEVLVKIYDTNKAEHYWIHKEYELTYDMNGNMINVPVFSAPKANGETETNSKSVHDGSKGSEAKLE